MPDESKLDSYKDNTITLDPKLLLTSTLVSGSRGSQGTQLSLELETSVMFQLCKSIRNVIPFVTVSHHNITGGPYELFSLRSLNGKTNGSSHQCIFRPSSDPPDIQWIFPALAPPLGSGVVGGIQTVSDREPEVQEGQIRKAVIISKPIWPIDEASMVMLDRHMEHHIALGFTG